MLFDSAYLPYSLIPEDGPEQPKKPEGKYTPSIDEVLTQFPQITSPEGEKQKVRILVHYFAWPDSVPLSDFRLDDPATWMSRLRQSIPTTNKDLMPLSGLSGAMVNSAELLSNGMFTTDALNSYQQVGDINTKIAQTYAKINKAESVVKEMVSRILAGFVLATELSHRGYEVEVVNAAAGTAGDQTSPTDTFRVLFSQMQALFDRTDTQVKIVDIPAGWNTFEEMKAALLGQDKLHGFIPISTDYHMARIEFYYNSVPEEINKLDPDTKVMFLGNPVVANGVATPNLDVFLGSLLGTLDPQIIDLLKQSALPAIVEAYERNRDRILYLAASLAKNAALDLLTVRGRINEHVRTSIIDAFRQTAQRRRISSTVRYVEASMLPSLLSGIEEYDKVDYTSIVRAFSKLNILFTTVDSWIDDKDETGWRETIWQKLIAVGKDLVNCYMNKTPEEIIELNRAELLPIIEKLKAPIPPGENIDVPITETTLFYELLLHHRVETPDYVNVHNISKYFELLESQAA